QVSRSHAAVVPRTGVIPCASAACESARLSHAGRADHAGAPRAFSGRGLLARGLLARGFLAHGFLAHWGRSHGVKRLRPAGSPVGRASASALVPFATLLAHHSTAAFSTTGLFRGDPPWSDRGRGPAEAGLDSSAPGNRSRSLRRGGGASVFTTLGGGPVSERATRFSRERVQREWGEQGYRCDLWVDPPGTLWAHFVPDHHHPILA